MRHAVEGFAFGAALVVVAILLAAWIWWVRKVL